MTETATGKTVLLSDLKAGSKAVVSQILGGEGFRKRLLDLGVVPGKEIEVISAHKYHPFIIRIDDAKIMLGWGMVCKLGVLPR